MDSQTITGGCYCGRLAFEIHLPVIRVVNCHCNMCRKLSGAAYTTWVSVNKASFSYTAGAEELSFFDLPDSTSYFCRCCGTRVVAVDKRQPDVVGVYLGIIHGDIHQAIDGHYFFSDKAEWLNLCDNLPRYGGETGFEPLP